MREWVRRGTGFPRGTVPFGSDPFFYFCCLNRSSSSVSLREVRSLLTCLPTMAVSWLFILPFNKP